MKMTKEEFYYQQERRQLWRMIAAAVAYSKTPYGKGLPTVCADEVLADYDKRFKAISPTENERHAST